MGFGFEQADEGLEGGLRRIAREEVARAQAELSDPTLGPEEKIHQARKRTKRVRGLLRLVRPSFPAYAKESTRLRDAARGLSDLRDRDVMIQTHDRLMEATGAVRARYAPARAHLTRARNRVAVAQDRDEALANFATQMSKLGKRAERWTLDKSDKHALSAGLDLTWRRASAALKRAAKRETIEDFHEWRKRVKDHWYQARLLRPISPKPLKDQARAAHELGLILGNIQDLDTYRLHFEGPEASGLNAERRAELVALTGDRIEMLEREALALGKRLFGPAAGDPANDWVKLWKAWRKAA